MIALIIGTHGRFSTELLKSSEMIFGDQLNVDTITFLPGEGTEDLVEKYNNSLKKLDVKDGVLFLVDLFGGSPFNAASMIAMEKENMEVVTGVNLPMLLEVFASRESVKLSELAGVALNSGKEAVRKLVKENSDSLEEDEL